MELGLALPTSGPQTSPQMIVKVAKEAEWLGYAALWTYERLLHPIDNVMLWSGGEPQQVPEVYRSVYEPLRRPPRGGRCGDARGLGPRPGPIQRRVLPDRAVRGEPETGTDQHSRAVGRDDASRRQARGRIADGLLPLTSSAEELGGVVSAFHAAAREAGRD
jgi:hypothetical protein